MMSRSLLEIGGAANEALERMVREIGVEKAEVIMNAMSLYQHVQKELLLEPRMRLALVIEGSEQEIRQVIMVPGIPYEEAKEESNGT